MRINLVSSEIDPTLFNAYLAGWAIVFTGAGATFGILNEVYYLASVREVIIAAALVLLIGFQ